MYATLLDEGNYHCTESTMHRILRDHGSLGRQRDAPSLACCSAARALWRSPRASATLSGALLSDAAGHQLPNDHPKVQPDRLSERPLDGLPVGNGKPATFGHSYKAPPDALRSWARGVAVDWTFGAMTRVDLRDTALDTRVSGNGTCVAKSH